MIQHYLTDEEWERVELELPQKPGSPGRRAKNTRLFVEAVLWVARTGAPWRELPDEFGKWFTVYIRFRRWSKKGVWERIFKAVSGEAVEYVLINGTICAAYERGAGEKTERFVRGAAVRAASP